MPVPVETSQGPRPAALPTAPGSRRDCRDMQRDRPARSRARRGDKRPLGHDRRRRTRAPGPRGGLTKENGRATRSPVDVERDAHELAGLERQRGASTRSENSASVQCRFSITRLRASSLIGCAIRLELQVLQLAAQHHDRAVAAVVAGVGELEGVGARDLQLAFVVARQAHAANATVSSSNCRPIALAGRAPGAQRALARAQAVEPEEYPCGNEDNRGAFPHRRYCAALSLLDRRPSRPPR